MPHKQHKNNSFNAIKGMGMKPKIIHLKPIVTSTGSATGGFVHVKYPPSIPVKDVSRKIINLRKKWMRKNFFGVSDKGLAALRYYISWYTNDLRQALQLRKRGRL